MDNLNNILQAEFYTSIGYFDRLVFALTELSDFHYTPNGRILLKEILEAYDLFFSRHFGYEKNDENIDSNKFKFLVKNYHQYIEKYIALPFSKNDKTEFVISFINLTYSLSNKLHSFVLKFTQYEIQYPRMSLIKENELDEFLNELSSAKLFYIDIADVLDLQNINQNQVSFLENKREERYDHFLHQGHIKMTEKDYEKALNHFYKAKNYKETAEVFTLIAWAYSFVNQTEKAKNYCLKAIAKDPQYGPAYNDFGNYLLLEGKAKDSFKWFELAKRAHNYQNREYPYINSGRAYMMLEEYTKALKEFQTALILAPFHDELHDTVKKLQMNLENKHHRNLQQSTEYESPRA